MKYARALMGLLVIAMAIIVLAQVCSGTWSWT